MAERAGAAGKSVAAEILEYVFRDGAPVRAVMIDGKPWFVAADVCRILGLGNPTTALLRLDADVNTLCSAEGIHAGAGYPTVNLVSESGLYGLVMRSRRSEARPFQKWVTGEVLPSIRQHGVYVAKRLSPSKARIAAEALLVAAHERSIAEGGAGLDERRLFHELAEEVVAKHPEWVVAAIGQWLHDCIYHVMARRERRLMQSRDPAQPDLPNLFSVMRDGRERAVARATLSLAEKLSILAHGFRTREGFQRFISSRLRRDRALVAEHNERQLEELITREMLVHRAPDLLQ